MTKPPKYPSMIGASTLLVIFAVLCMTVFSLLSLSTAQSRSRLSAAAAENTRSNDRRSGSIAASAYHRRSDSCHSGSDKKTACHSSE